MTIEEKIEVIKAFNEGKKIEVYDGQWKEKLDTDIWNFESCSYRVKPYNTNLKVVNKLIEDAFGIKNYFNDKDCPLAQKCDDKYGYDCDKCKTWWNEPYKEPSRKGE